MILDGTTVENKSKLILTDGGRPRGRPRVTYEECIEEMGRKVSKSIVELKRMAQDRKKWKSFTENPPTLISN